MIDTKEIEKITTCLLNGGIVLLPTDTVYGLAVNPNIDSAVDRLYKFKARPRKLPLPIMVSKPAHLTSLGLDINHYATSILNSKHMPGAVTLVMGFNPLPIVKWLKGREECGIRIPNDERLLKILDKTGPLLVTSANKHGIPAIPQSPEEILAQLDGTPDLVIKGGQPKSIPSTIVNCRFSPPVIERSGNVSLEELEQCFG